MALAFDTPAAVRNRDTARMREYARLLAFYRGDQWDTQRTALNRQGGQRRLTLNYAASFVNKSAAYVMQDLAFVCDPTDDTDAAADNATAAETAYAQVAQQNALDVLDFENEIDVSVLGDAAYKVTWDERVRVTTPDVTGLYLWRQPDDPDVVVRVAERHVLTAADARAFYGQVTNRRDPALIEDWTIDTYTLWLDGQIRDQRPNPYGFIPYVVYPNIREPKREWGTSDIPAVESAARELNRQATQLSAICELSGQPVTVFEGVTEAADVGMQPGAVWTLPEGAKAYVLDLLANGGVRLMLDYAELVRAFMHDLGETPRSAFGENDRGLSGVALKVSLDPLNKKVTRKRLIRTRALIQRNSMALRLLEQFAGLDPGIASLTVRPAWGDINPNDRARDVADGVALINAAVASRRRIAGDLGIADPDAEFERILDESARLTDVQPTQTPTPQRTTGAANI